MENFVFAIENVKKVSDSIDSLCHGVLDLGITNQETLVYLQEIMNLNKMFCLGLSQVLPMEVRVEVSQIDTTTYDLYLLFKNLSKKEMSDDEVANILIGVSGLHKMRCDALEECVVGKNLT